MEREFQKALAIEYLKEYLKENNLSINKLQTQRFFMVCNECAFEQPNDVMAEDYVIDGGDKSIITLIMKYENGEIRVEQTEYTKEFLSAE